MDISEDQNAMLAAVAGVVYEWVKKAETLGDSSAAPLLEEIEQLPRKELETLCFGAIMCVYAATMLEEEGNH